MKLRIRRPVPHADILGFYDDIEFHVGTSGQLELTGTSQNDGTEFYTVLAAGTWSTAILTEEYSADEQEEPTDEDSE